MAHEDYDVYDGERDVGRIYRLDDRPDSAWFWGGSFQLTGRKSYGRAESLKAAFRAEYERWQREPGKPTRWGTRSAEQRETEMSGKRVFVVLSVAAGLGILNAAPAAAAGETRWWERGGFVKPCSLDGVNPAYHPYIFGNPAFARAVYGFVQSRDGAWHVINNCHIYN